MSYKIVLLRHISRGESYNIVNWKNIVLRKMTFKFGNSILHKWVDTILRESHHFDRYVDYSLGP
jgi:hypothetical protein